MLKLSFAVASDRGLVRGNNEDSAYAGPHLLALADGMGGHAAGEIASQLMINHLRALDVDPGDQDMLALMDKVAAEANAAIAEGIQQDPSRDGMGTTLTALLFNGNELAQCHVGDSRGYRLRDGKLTQITVDDTYVQSLVEQGELAAEDVSTHPQRSLILKAYAGHPVEPTLKLIDARPGDRLLLCSDGLSDPVSHDTIEEALGTSTPQDAADRLVDLALRSGGPDNVTVVIADIVEVDDATAESDEEMAPVTAGALNGEQPYDHRPNTAAGRAAMIRQPQVVPPASEQPTGQVDAPEKPKRRITVTLVVTLICLIAVATAGWWGFSRLDSRFFVTVGDQNSLSIEKGANYAIFGFDLHSHYQQACLTRDGKLSLNVSCAGDQPFKLTDLPASVRSSVPNLPAGSYDEIQAQMQRLADEILPVCVTKESETGTEPPAGGDRSEPGVNCREVVS